MAIDALMGGVWTIFPHISIAGFDGGGGGVLLSHFSWSHSLRISDDSTLLAKKHPDEAASQSAAEQFKFLRYVVEQEDYATGIRQQLHLPQAHEKW